ncbi:DUF2723 domain-containing protein [Candidatus Neomarinimicrobiota bacterium]
MIQIQFKRWNRLLAGFLLLISFIVYFDTMAPTVSMWDCGEWIATAFSLGIPHPPGAPLYLLLGRLFSLLPFSSDVAFRVNLISPIVSALTVMFLYLIIVKVIAHWRKSINTINDVIIAFGGATIGALVFAFSDSQWFNAVEAEVYSISTLFTAIVVWLILHWSERADEPGNERYILMVAYLIGLATGIHLLNLLALPFIALIIYFKKRSFEWRSFIITVIITGVTFVVIHNGIIKGLPKLASYSGLSAIVVVVLGIFSLMVWSIVTKRSQLALIFTALALILIGYSTYTTIFVRSGQNPNIDFGNPETTSAAISYLDREQYGTMGQMPRRYTNLPPIYEVVGRPVNGNDFSSSQKRQYKFHNLDKQWNYFLSYQVNKMYWRYFLWQFAGRGSGTESGVTAFGASTSEDGVKWTQFGLPLALLLGFVGLYYHFSKDRQEAFALLTLFLLTGLAIIIYINQDNPQPRERDYSYVASFMTFAIWIGIGAASILEKIFEYVREKKLSRNIALAVIIVLMVFVPGIMLQANYATHDRSGNYIAWDMSYNILQSCEPNSILFTGGDNDTFPLWYLQEVENVRTDVIIANLSLLNTDWYIKQLRDLKPEGERFITLTDNQIREITSGLQPWKSQEVRIPVEGDSLNSDGFIEWTLNPTYANGQALRVQDLMIIRIINDAKWRYPIYWAVTSSASNKIGLDDYTSMEGLTFKLNSHKVDQINPEMLNANLMVDIGPESWSFNYKNTVNDDSDVALLPSKNYQRGYLFRNLGNTEVHYSPQIVRLLQNYRTAYLQLVVHYYFQYDNLQKNPGTSESEIEQTRQDVLTILGQMDKNLPPDVIPVASKDLSYQFAFIYGKIGDTNKMRSILSELLVRSDVTVNDKLRYGQTYAQELGDYEAAVNIFEELNNTYLTLENAIKIRGLNKTKIDQSTWNQWQQIYPEIISSLVLTNRSLDRIDRVEEILLEWLRRNPDDVSAEDLLEEIRVQRSAIDSG